MKKLTLEHLAGYLPYNVRFIECWEPSFTNQPDIINNRIMNISNINILLVTKRYKFKYAKPILRPLSDLTKEIEVGGEKFVPLFKMAQIEFKAERYKFDFNEMKIENSFPWGNKFRIKIKFSKHLGIVEFGYAQSTHFFYFENHTNKSGFSPCIHNREMLKKLYSWHFDIHNLISEGLAIDINTI